MRRIVVFSLIAAFACLPMTPAVADDKCDANRLAKGLEERMRADGRSSEDIRSIIDSSFKRKVLKGRIESQTGCSSEQVDAALEVLRTAVTG